MCSSVSPSADQHLGDCTTGMYVWDASQPIQNNTVMYLFKLKTFENTIFCECILCRHLTCTQYKRWKATRKLFRVFITRGNIQRYTEKCATMPSYWFGFVLHFGTGFKIAFAFEPQFHAHYNDRHPRKKQQKQQESHLSAPVSVWAAIALVFKL